ncbi:hypothetical protein LTR02_006580 [Friedmanniomyces endolithicus]|nr:hypothetical protein LTR94_009287 [Friedmanniomyces endolithicus]KAK0797070.1 hypothetical protein LTR59_006915 [Friedmanniomyces endolithicus]KAK0798004.1 hypothetical protein LTR38_007998 [Friedmanniomyces endolithicus]KAK0850083.1 hypothetical protein LTR03_004797 [Friedmanniomyces endolithicus]KAK0866074.1 hypothetical protein LTS02_004994 [Friedmanniomyces endolithicus]
MANPPPQHNSYLPLYTPPQVAHHEWRTASNSAAYLLPSLSALATSTPNLRLLDVGCGSGTISTSLAALIPSGSVTATDISPEILARAKDLAAKAGVANISFQEADIYALPFEDGTFDVVHASMVLSHLDDPVQAYREMLRVTRPNGGLVANRESDLRMWSYYPPLPGLRRAHEVLLATTREGGGNVDAGAKLVAWAMEAGVGKEAIEVSMGTWMYSSVEERRMWGDTMVERCRRGGGREKALEMGIATEADFESMAEAWAEWQAAEDACHGMMHGEILIRK